MTVDVDVLARGRALVRPGQRALLGIAGAPGSGKSTLAAALSVALAPDAVLVPMDGYHLAGSVLARSGSTARKGAPDTFDAAGFVALLRRLRAADEPVVYAPEFRRDIEEPIAGAVAVGREVPLVIIEGNYLLVDDGPWAHVRTLLDEVWFVEVDESCRVDRLIRRRLGFGQDPAVAQTWARGSDQRNADVVSQTRHRADLIVPG